VSSEEPCVLSAKGTVTDPSLFRLHCFRLNSKHVVPIPRVLVAGAVAPPAWGQLTRGGEPKKSPVAAFVLAVLLVAWGSVAPMYAADSEDDLGSWVGANTALRYSDRWSLFLQGEVRTWEPVSNLNELLFRAAGHYDFNKRYMGAFGYVRVETWPYSDSRYNKFYENRIFQEFLIKASWGRGKVAHRFRLEQRWITTQEFGREYSNRARYKLGYTLPLKSDKLGPGTSFFKVLNEVFIDFDRGDYWFDLEEAEAGLNQNRLWVGGGRQFTALSKLEIGVLWQHRPKADFIRLVVSYSHNFDFHSKAD
jgi:hypothetical protein